jgi:hypothetical protein
MHSRADLEAARLLLHFVEALQKASRQPTHYNVSHIVRVVQRHPSILVEVAWAGFPGSEHNSIVSARAFRSRSTFRSMMKTFERRASRVQTLRQRKNTLSL